MSDFIDFKGPLSPIDGIFNVVPVLEAVRRHAKITFPNSHDVLGFIEVDPDALSVRFVPDAEGTREAARRYMQALMRHGSRFGLGHEMVLPERARRDHR